MVKKAQYHRKEITMAKEITFYNDFREGWLAYILGEDYDSKQSDSWKEGWDTAMETKIYDETRDVVYGCIRKGRIIISNLPDSPALEKKEIDWDELIQNDSFIGNICLTYRHDFGLLNTDSKSMLIFQCKEWLNAIRKNLPSPPKNE